MYEFDDNDEQFAGNESAAEEVLEEFEDDDVEAVQDYTNEVMDQAMQKIEEANLFKLLINSSVFGADSARPEILASVNKKVRQFAIRELQRLLGLKSEEDEVKAAAPVAAQFSETEAHVLRMLIEKVMRKEGGAQVPTSTTSEVKPELKPIQANPTPKMNTVATPASTSKAQPAAPTKKAVKTKEAQRKTVSKGFAKPSKGNVKPKPMPTAEQMINNGLIGTPNIQMTAEAGVGQKAAAKGQVTMASLIGQFSGGNTLHVDQSNPSDSVAEGGGDTNERF